MLVAVAMAWPRPADEKAPAAAPAEGAAAAPAVPDDKAVNERWGGHHGHHGHHSGGGFGGGYENYGGYNNYGGKIFRQFSIYEINQLKQNPFYLIGYDNYGGYNSYGNGYNNYGLWREGQKNADGTPVAPPAGTAPVAAPAPSVPASQPASPAAAGADKVNFQ